MVKVALYIAKHNKTGLKYFGKTTQCFTEDSLQKNYHGSGTYWGSHLFKHGDDVTMEVYGVFDITEVKQVALKFSRENNIVESKEWANLKEENGLDGGFDKITHKKACENKHKTILDNGLSLYQNSILKAAKTCKETILDNGLTIAQNKAIKAAETMKITAPNRGKNISKALNEIQENGLSKSKNRGIKGGKTRKISIEENGLSISQNIANKVARIRKERGDYDGSSNPRALKINIYNKDDELKFEAHGNLKEVCKENDLSFTLIRESYLNNTKLSSKRGKNKKYFGWYAKIV